MSDNFADSQEFVPTAKAVAVARTIAHGAQGVPNASRAVTGPGITAAIPAASAAVHGAIGPVADTTPGPMTTVANVLGYGGILAMPAMAAPFVLSVIPKGFGHTVKFVGKIPGLSALQEFGQGRIDNAVHRGKAIEAWSDRTLESRFPGFQDSPVFSAIETPVVNTIRGIDKAVNLSGARISRMGTLQERALGKLAAPVNQFGTFLDQHAGVLGGHEEFGNVQKHFTAFREAVASKNIEQLNDARVNLAESIGRLNNSEQFKGVTAEGLRPVAAPVRAWRSVTGYFRSPKVETTIERAGNKLVKEFQALNHHAHHASAAASKANWWNDLKSGASYNRLGKRIGEMGTMHVALNAGFLASNIAMNLHSMQSFRTQLHQFQAVYKGITGKDCSTWTALMGDMPPVLKHAQKELFRGGMKEAGINAFITGIDTAFFFTKHGGMLMMGAQMVGGQMREAMECHVPVVQMEQAMAAAQKEGKQLQPVHYAELLQAAAPDTIGQVKTTNTMFVKLCNQLASEQWSAMSVLKAVNDGSINTMASKIQQEMAAQGRQPKETVESVATAKATEIPAAANSNLAPAANQNHSAPVKAVVNGGMVPTTHIPQPAQAVHIAPTHSISARIG